MLRGPGVPVAPLGSMGMRVTKRGFGVLAGVLVIALAGVVIATRGDACCPVQPPASIRANPQVAPFEGLGVWVDIYDSEAWADPSAAVADMAAHGVRTLYLQTSNFSRPSAFVNPAGVAAFLDVGASAGVQVVAWYLPGLQDVATDASRAQAAIDLQTPAGNRFDGFALDIESRVVKDPVLRTRRLLELSAMLRTAAGQSYPLGAIVPSPAGLRRVGWWRGFPWTRLAQTFDAVMPMTYFTFRTSSEAGAQAYATKAIHLVRTWVGNDRVPIHLIGGIAQDATTDATQGFVQGADAQGVLGVSYYTWPGITDEQWGALAQVTGGG
jgi:hypothetical protein